MTQIYAAVPATQARHRAGTCAGIRPRAQAFRHGRAATACQAAAAIGVAIALALSASPAALARGGGHMGHAGGLGHMGLGQAGHGGLGGERGQGAIMTPAYVLISTTGLSDKDAFATVLHRLPNAVLPFEGRVISDGDRPPSWDGAAAAHVTMIQFDSADAAQLWKSSDAYKSFDEQLKKVSTSSIAQLQGEPVARPAAMANARMHGRGRGLNPQAYEPIVKEYDSTLKKMHGICSGC